MYSRYSGISIPKNYGGSRFQPDNEPAVKTHRANNIGGATKSAHSPSFVSSVPFPEPNIQQQMVEGNAEMTNNEEFFEEVDKESPIEPLEEVFESQEEVFDEVKTVSNESQDFSAIKDILSRFDKDALLILGLILLLMSDGDKKNDDIIVLLALLLLG